MINKTTETHEVQINGLLVTLSRDTDLAQRAIANLEGHQLIQLGEKDDIWQPVVVEANSVKHSHELHEWIESIEGVITVDVVMSSADAPKNSTQKKRELR